MKLVNKVLLLAALLVLSPTLALAGFDDVADPVVPEPTSALLMAAGLVTFGLVWRSRRR